MHGFHHLFLQGFQNGHDTPTELAAFVWQILQMQGQKVVKDVRVLETAEENIDQLKTEAEAFSGRNLRLLQALKIAQ